ncbi:MAG: twin-arginine translocation signal domain-containing protein [Planctomycetota bacterium]|jgi:aryl-phospho-beta-D-glucosidase BglC (GH1 family)
MDNNRRDFLKTAAAGMAAATLPAYARQPKKKEKNGKSVAQTALPRWRGFNLLDMFTMRSKGDFQEDDFRWIRDLGFDFVRFPMCYRLWIKNGDDYKIHEPRQPELPPRAGLFGEPRIYRAP